MIFSDAVIFRQMELKDVDAVQLIEETSFAVPWSREAFLDELKNERARYIVGEAAGEVVAYMGMWLVFDEADIMNVAVLKKWRGRGIGRRLVEFAIKKAAEQGCTSMTLEVRRSNAPAIALYEKLGFKNGGARKNYYKNPTEDAIIMWNHSLI